jgi:hypothetical protein
MAEGIIYLQTGTHLSVRGKTVKGTVRVLSALTAVFMMWNMTTGNY